MHLWNRKGQNTAEYAILIAVVIGAIVAMQIYVKRGLQGKVKDVTDHVGDGLPADAAGNKPLSQYDPYYNDSNYDVSQDQNVNEKYLTGGKVSRSSISEKTTRAVGGFSNTGVDVSEDDGWTERVK